MLRQLGSRGIGHAAATAAQHQLNSCVNACLRHNSSSTFAQPCVPAAVLNNRQRRPDARLRPMPVHQSTRGAGTASQYRGSCKDNTRLMRSVDLLTESIFNKSLSTAWQAYRELADLESTLDRAAIVDELHKALSQESIHSILRAIIPAFTHKAENMDEAAQHVYQYVKLLNYLLLVSKLHKKRRNEVAVVRLVVGQCMRRLIDSRFVRTTGDARKLVRKWRAISEGSPPAMQLTSFDVHLLVLGAWKSERHILIPYLYELECEKWVPGGDAAGFQRVSATVLSFYVQRCAEIIRPAVVRSLLEDLSQRGIRMLPHHYSMLILYFGKVRNMGEAMKVLERAMDDPAAQKTEAVYYYALRAFSSAFSPQAERKVRAGEKGLYGNDASATVEHDEGNDELGYVDDTGSFLTHAGIDRNAPADADLDDGSEELEQRQKHSAEHVQAAKICTSIFQLMIERNIDIRYRTYRELIDCMAQFRMFDKARQIFEFAIDNLDASKIKPHFVAFYLRKTTRTPHEMQISLRQHLENMPDLLMLFRQFPTRALADYFGIYHGDLQAFLDRRKRPAVEGRAGEFLTDYLQTMNKATRMADFLKCVLSGNDQHGKFKGYNFPKLGSDGSGVATVESEVIATCRWIEESGRLWLRHKAVIYNLLPVLPGIALSADDPAGVRFIRRLVGECRNVQEFMNQLDDARIEQYDISMVNQFLRVKYLGLTFQRYVKEKAVLKGRTHRDANSSSNKGELFWPSFMYSQSSGPMAQYAPLGSISRENYSHDVAHSVSAAAESWEHMLEMRKSGVCDSLALDTYTVAIFSLVSILSEDWQFGRKIWDDMLAVLETMGNGKGAHPERQGLTYASLNGVGVYKQYLYYLTMASKATANSSHSRSRSEDRKTPAQRSMLPAPNVPARPHLFCDDAIADMFATMSKNGVPVSSGLLCQGIRAALETGHISIAGALEQWQLYRERRGLAAAGYLREYFGAQPLPEIPIEQGSVLGLVRRTEGCPRLSRFIGEQMSSS
ncbi:hypothetical protein GQ54DRAFT_59367 [Martensiomyces pterosporus]|nr:hypothetical protein GQ54DRAFT_59367 [Martensiomyces pterosporus]